MKLVRTGLLLVSHREKHLHKEQGQMGAVLVLNDSAKFSN